MSSKTQEIKVKCEFEQMVKTSQLVENPKNANKHSKEQVQRLAKLLEFQGWRHPIIVSSRSGFIVAGHGRLLAAKHLGLEEVPVDYQDFKTEAEEYAFVISDNEIARWAELDEEKMIEDLKGLDLGDIDLLGIEDFEYKLPTDEEKEKIEDEVPEPPKEAKVKRGEIYILGDHRLMCGDSTSAEDVARLMNGKNSEMLFTDPPYGIGYEYSNHDDSDPIKNEKLVQDVFSYHSCGKVWTPGLMNLSRDISRFGKTKVLVWYKKFAQAGNGVGGASTWEPVLVFNPLEKNLKNDVLTIQTERETLNGKSLRDLHSCPKPVSLFEQLIKSFSKEKSLIFEPFCGSGTTLIACEKTNRICFSMEQDPVYCDVILDRWQAYSGKKAHREDGVAWDEIKGSVVK